MNNKKYTIMYSIGLSSIALVLAFMIWPNNNNSAIAQQNSTTTTSGAMTPNRPNSMMSMSSGLQNQNWTGSISLFSPILDAFKSKIHMTLNDATTNAISAVGAGPGSNASALAAFIHPERGFLVYNVLVLDSSNNIHRVIIDPGNGKILSNQPMSMMDMMLMMHHPSMGMGGMMMMGPSHGMDMMQHGSLGGGGTSMGMMGNSPQGMSMMNRGMGMGMMGPQAGGTWP
jgi:hypothetical protein